MSTTAAELSTTLSEDNTSEPSVDSTDAIANLLVGEDEPEIEEAEGEETQTQDSIQDEGEESNDEEASDDDEETSLEAVADGDDDTWESVLGVKDGDLAFKEDGSIDGVNVKVSGEQSTVSMPDLIAGYQNNKSNTNKSQSLADEVRNFGVQKEQVEQLYASKLDSVSALSEYFEKQIISDYEGVNWEQLRIDNPAEYAALKSDFSAKAGELQSIQDAINADKESLNEETNKEMMGRRQTFLKEQFDKMLVNNPEWSDESTRIKAKAEYQSFVQDKYGFSEQEFDTVFDARLIELIKDAKKYHSGAAVASKKRQKKVPSFQKSRGTTAKKTSKLEKLTAASRKAHGAEKRGLQTSAVAELLIGR